MPRLCRLLLASFVCLLSACVSTGHAFNAANIGLLVPGQSTYSDVALNLGAPPAQVYRQANGNYVAWWMHKTSIVNDGLYGRQSVAFEFTAANHLLRMTDSTNILVEPWVKTRLMGLSPSQYSLQ